MLTVKRHSFNYISGSNAQAKRWKDIAVNVPLSASGYDCKPRKHEFIYKMLNNHGFLQRPHHALDWTPLS